MALDTLPSEAKSEAEAEGEAEGEAESEGMQMNKRSADYDENVGKLVLDIIETYKLISPTIVAGAKGGRRPSVHLGQLS